jgi:hypothetical protein
MTLAAFNPPRRGDAPRTSTNFQHHASIISNLGNPQEDGQAIPGNSTPPPRPPKCNVQMVYDLTSDFPNLPPRTNENDQNTAQPQDAPQITPPESQANSTPASSATMDELTKFKDVIKQEFLAMIQKEVQTQIQTQMQALQTDMKNLTAKIDGMQEGIRGSIGATVRDAIMHSMNHTAPHQAPNSIPEPPAQSENSQDGACQKPTGTCS